jgi:hypothetical protein
MYVGDLVKRKSEWAEWVEYNPWMSMFTEEDKQIGIVIKQKGSYAVVLWPTGATIKYRKKELEIVT